MSDGLVLGVDGGNSKTIALVAGIGGAVLGAGRAGGSDLHSTESPAAALDAIATAVTAALAAIPVGHGGIVSSCFSLAGADWPEDFALLGRELPERLGVGGRVTVVNDAIGALRAGTEDGIGVAVVCGTGGAVGARGPGGRTFHLGFWPDATGARAIGRHALDAVWRAELGSGPPTSLTAHALERYMQPTAWDLLHAFTRRDGIAGAAKDGMTAVVLDEAERGDAVSLAIVERQAAILAEQASICAREAGLPAPAPLVLAGGVLRHPSTRLPDRIAALLGAVPVLLDGIEPVVGALMLAADAAGVGLLADDLRATAPAPSFFATLH